MVYFKGEKFQSISLVPESGNSCFRQWYCLRLKGRCRVKTWLQWTANRNAQKNHVARDGMNMQREAGKDTHLEQLEVDKIRDRGDLSSVQFQGTPVFSGDLIMWVFLFMGLLLASSSFP